MKHLFLFSVLISGFQPIAQNGYYFTINPNIDTTSAINQLIIQNLKNFLSTKNSNLTAHNLWDSTDFTTYKYPYRDIYWIETGWPKKHNYNPTLIAIIPADEEDKYVLRIAFMETQDENSVFLKTIYNIMASVNNSAVIFSRYTNYATRNWHTPTVGSISYISSPHRKFSMKDARKQEEFTKFLSGFFDVGQIPITYYSCVDAEEMFHIKGFDYNMQMYLHKTGGQAGFNNNLYSGNNRDIYNHEVVHFYLAAFLKTKWNALLNEGIATYLGGSNEIEYAQHRGNLALYVSGHPDFDFTKHLNPYASFFLNGDDTSVPYTIGALICEMAYKKGGKELLLKIVAETDNWKAFELLGLNKENLSVRLGELLELEAYLIPAQ